MGTTQPAEELSIAGGGRLRGSSARVANLSIKHA